MAQKQMPVGTCKCGNQIVRTFVEAKAGGRIPAYWSDPECWTQGCEVKNRGALGAEEWLTKTGRYGPPDTENQDG